MAISGSVDFNPTAIEIITDAMIGAGVLDPSESPEATQAAYAFRALNRMTKAWQQDGMSVFGTAEGSLPLVGGKEKYTMGSSGDFAIRPLRIIGARWRDTTGIDLPMTELARQEYFDLPQKLINGTPTTWYYDPENDTGNRLGALFIWPRQDTVTTETIEFTYQRVISDFDTNANTSDIPQYWMQAIHDGLVYQLMKAYFPTPDYIGKVQQAAIDAQASYERASDFDRETASVFFGPDDSGR